MTSTTPRSEPSALLSRLGKAARNALTLMREGRLGAPYQAPFEVAFEDRRVALRHYRPAEDASEALPRPRRPLLLVPPLMVTSEIYDISPELSAVAFLTAAGVDTWLADFGAPEEKDGGLERTLDDHVLGISACIDQVRALTGEDVHLVGYSQGGMFCYQAAAWRKAANLPGVASIITFGAPVDIRRNLPVKVHETLAEKLIAVARRAIDRPLEDLRGLPGSLSSRGFKLLAPRQEVKHLVQMLGLLHDEDALQALEPKRRFLGGEGFIAWPGPALRKFIDEFVVHNRMKQGGFVIAKRTASLADLTEPICCFVGETDDLALPESVRAIAGAAPHARVYPVHVRAGHFGLVIGSAAMEVSWPTVVRWAAWQDGLAPEPEMLRLARERSPRREVLADQPEPEAPAQKLYDLATEVVDDLWARLGEVGVDVTRVIESMRWQLPRMAKMATMHAGSRVSFARVLAEQARAIPEAVCFLWEGRAFTYAAAHARVTDIARSLAAWGVRRGHHVGVFAHNHPDFLTLVVALNRLGAVAVLLNAELRGASLDQALTAGEVDRLVCDEAHLAAGARFSGPLAIIGAGARAGLPTGLAYEDLEALVQRAPALPEDNLDAGRGGDLALLIFTSGTTGLPRAARITNLRWIAAGLGSATNAQLTPADTVYCCLPLYHATGLLVAVGGALIGGSRLALAPSFSARRFWGEVRNVGANVVFYVGELCRYLVAQPPSEADKRHPVRLFAGNGLAPDVWRAMRERFGDKLRVLEFYSATEGIVVLMNATGDKVGSVGRELTGTVKTALVRYDPDSGRPLRDGEGRFMHAVRFEPGLLVARIEDEAHPLASFAGYTDEAATASKILRDGFAEGDRWFDTGDVLTQDEDGDFWFVDRVGDTWRHHGENVSSELVAGVLRQVPGVRAVAAYGVKLDGVEGKVGMVALELEDGLTFDPHLAKALHDAVVRDLSPAARPRFVRVVPRLELTDSLKIKKVRLAADGADPGRIGEVFGLDPLAASYVPLDTAHYLALASRV